jgi:ABC-type lipoprotein release transport system permease subunit
MIAGIDPELEPTVSRLREFVKAGSYFTSADEPEALIGKSLAHKLKVNPGDKLSFYLQSFEGGEDVVESFRIKGVCASGISSLDKMLVYLPLRRAQKVMKMENRINEIALRVDDPKNLELLKADLKARVANEEPRLTVAAEKGTRDGKEFELLKIREPAPLDLIMAPEALAEAFKRNAEVSNLSLRLELPLQAVHRRSPGREKRLELEALGVEPVSENKISGIFEGVEIRGDSWLRGTEMDKELDVNRGWVILSEAAAQALEAEAGDTIELASRGKVLSLEVAGILKRAGDGGGKPLAVTARRDLWETFVGRTAASEIAVRLKENADARKTGEELFAGLRLEVQDWKELVPVLAQMTAIMNYANLVLLFCIYIIIAFGIANTMIMAVFERVRELGILKAIGTSPERLFAMVVLESIMLALLGLLIGALVSAGTVWLWARNGLDLSMFAAGLETVGMPTRLYPALTLRDILTAAFMAVAIAILSALYPALRASRIPVVEAIRRF